MAFAEDYVPVADRITAFREMYPTGSLRPADLSHPFQMVDVGDRTFVVVVSAAYRTPEDVAPGIGMAWEPVPGLTNFTKNSELQNCETSSWGRAIIAVGAADAKKGIASREDVQNRQAEADVQEDPAVPGLRSAIIAAINKLTDPAKEGLKVWFAENGLPPVAVMNAAQCDVVIGRLMETDVAP